jgi:hypothetical protein
MKKNHEEKQCRKTKKNKQCRKTKKNNHEEKEMYVFAKYFKKLENI